LRVSLLPSLLLRCLPLHVKSLPAVRYLPGLRARRCAGAEQHAGERQGDSATS